MDDCPICLCPMGDEVAGIACGHSMHEGCLAQLRQYGLNNMCPLCRTPLSELRTVHTLHDEMKTLLVRYDRAHGCAGDGTFFLGKMDFAEDVKSLKHQTLSLAQEAFNLDPDSFETQFWLGECMMRNEFYSEAKHILKSILSAFEGHAHIEAVHLLYAQAMSKLKDYAEAFRQFRITIQLDPSWAKPRMNFGCFAAECLLHPDLGFQPDDDLISEAKHHLQEAIKLNPADQSAKLFLMALNNYKRLRPEVAKLDLDRIREDCRFGVSSVVRFLPAGARVRIVNLQSSEGKTLNGKVCTINRTVDAEDRIRVEIDGNYKRLKASNLVAIPPPVLERLFAGSGSGTSSAQLPDDEASLHVSPVSTDCPQTAGGALEHEVDPAKDQDTMLQVALAESFDAEFEASLNHLQHSEPPVEVHPLEAARVAQQLAATWEFPNQAPSDGSHQPRRLLCLTFSRHPAKLVDALMDSPPARAAIAAGVNIQPDWAKGGRVFVRDVQPGFFDEELCAYQVVIYEEDEQALWTALDHLPYSIKKLKPGTGRTMVPGNVSQFEVSSTESLDIAPIEVSIKNTFIHVGHSADDSQSAHTV